MPTIIRRGPRPGSANQRRSTAYRVLMRDQRSGPNHGKWAPITTSGFTVICPSKLEACELVFMVGQKDWVRPDPQMTEDQYLDWLLTHHFRLESYIPTTDAMTGVDRKAMEVSFALFLRGWYPSAADIPGVLPGMNMTTAVVQNALESRWRGL